MASDRRTGFREFIVLPLLAGVCWLGLTLLTQSEAGATSNQVQFNMLGLDNGQWGNDGQLGSANFLWTNVGGYAYANGGAWPLVATMSEICSDNYNPNLTSQYDLMLWNFGTVGLWGAMFVEDINSSPPLCISGGNAVWAIGDSHWASGDNGDGIERRAWNAQNGPHIRGWVCLDTRISGFNYNYRACGTHLSTDEPTADSETYEANIQIHSYSLYVPVLWGGDFNLSTQWNGNPPRSGHIYSPNLVTWYSGGNHFEAGNSLVTFPTANVPLDQYRGVDHFGYSSPQYHVLAGAQVWLPGIQTCYCSGSGHPYSDHWLLRVYVGT